MANSQKPVEEVRIGSIKAAIWQKDSETGPRFSVSFSRIYKEGDEWKNTSSFWRDDLLLLAKVADQAHSRIFELHQQARQAAAE
jgi:hypothetical protein